MNWLEILAKHENVTSVNKEGSLITVKTNDSRPDLLLLENQRIKVNGLYFQTLLNTYKFNFFLCYNKNYFLDADVVKLLKTYNISYGDAKDVFRLLNNKNIEYHNFINKDSEYIIKNLDKNSNVKNFNLLENRKIIVFRYNGRPITFIFINDYQITHERLNEVYQLYAPFDFILAANPNARWLIKAYNGVEVKIGLWAELFSFLANKNS